MARPVGSALSKHLPPPNTLSHALNATDTLEETTKALHGVLDSIDLSPSWRSAASCTVTAEANSWSRSARRKKGRGEVPDDQGGSEAQPFLIVGMRISVDVDRRVNRLEGDWQYGLSRKDFESFWNHVVTKMDGRAGDASMRD